MPSLQEIYAKFGDAAEAAQLLETQIGNLLLTTAVEAHGLAEARNKALARKILEEVDRKTLGQLVKALKKVHPSAGQLEETLALALAERNRLNHSFYRQHNFRRNTEEGRLAMFADLDVIHGRLLDAYQKVLFLSGIDITNVTMLRPPIKHVPI